jgi:hypothetical protein
LLRGCGVDGMGDLEEGRHRSRAAADRASLVAVPRSQSEAILARDFFTADQLDGTQAYVLSLLEHASGCIRIPGVAHWNSPDQVWARDPAQAWVGDHLHRHPGREAAHLRLSSALLPLAPPL